MAVLLLTWLGWAAWEHSRPSAGGTLHGFEVVSPHQVRVVVDLTRVGGDGVTCDVTAQASDHSSVGEGSVAAPPGPAGQVRETATIRTDREATTATVSNCRTAR